MGTDATMGADGPLRGSVGRTGQAAALVARWQARLGLSHWRLLVSDRPPDEDDSRSEVDIDRNVLQALLRFDPVLPDDQLERQVVHELVHVRLAELDDVFRQVSVPDSVPRTWWGRAEEATVEALVVALLPGMSRREYRGTWAGPGVVAVQLGPPVVTLERQG